MENHDVGDTSMIKSKPVLSTLVFSLSLILIAVLAVKAFEHRNRSNNVLSVTGLAKQDFESDLIVWSGSFVRRHKELKGAYGLLKADAEVVKNFVTEMKVTDSEYTFSSINIEKEYDEVRDKQGNVTRTFKGYLLTQHVTIESKEVEKIEAVARDITRVIDKGIEFYSQAPSYFYTKLGELKIEMIAAASRDGRVRAEKIVENAKGKLGELRNSNIGIFQITKPNSSADYTWEGAYDTASRKKTAAITIKLQFGLIQ